MFHILGRPLIQFWGVFDYIYFRSARINIGDRTHTRDGHILLLGRVQTNAHMPCYSYACGYAIFYAIRYFFSFNGEFPAILYIRSQLCLRLEGVFYIILY